MWWGDFSCYTFIFFAISFSSNGLEEENIREPSFLFTRNYESKENPNIQFINCSFNMVESCKQAQTTIFLGYFAFQNI